MRFCFGKLYKFCADGIKSVALFATPFATCPPNEKNSIEVKII